MGKLLGRSELGEDLFRFSFLSLGMVILECDWRMRSYGISGCRQVALGFRVATLNLNQLDAELEKGKGIFLLRGEHRNFSRVQGASSGKKS